MPSVLKNPANRNRIASLFKLQYSDEQIAKALDISKNQVVSTRIDMGLKRPRNPNPNPDFTPNLDGRPVGADAVKRKPANKNARVNPFAVLRAYLDQDVKNMSDVAKQFKCSRAYVSRLLIQARGDDIYPGILNHRNQLYIADNDALLKSIVGDE